MGIRRGEVNFSVSVFKRFRRSSTLHHRDIISFYLLLRAVSLLLRVANGGGFEKRAFLTFKNLDFHLDQRE